MCKFHADVANEIARDPATGKSSDLYFTLVNVAFGRHWLDCILDQRAHLTSFSRHDLASSDAQRVFRASPLSTVSDDVIEERRPFLVSLVQGALADVVDRQSLTLASLGLANPKRIPRYMNQAVIDIFEGDPAQPMTLKDKAPRAWQEPVRRAVADLLAVPGVDQALRQLLADTATLQLRHAPAQVTTRVQNLYELIPATLRRTFGTCSHGAAAGLSGHAMCGVLMLSSSGLAASLAGPAMFAGPVLAGGLQGFFNWRAGDRLFNAQFAGAVAVSMAVAGGIAYANAHDHGSDDGNHHHHHNALQRFQDEQLMQARSVYPSLPPKLRMDVDRAAKEQGISNEMFLVNCTSDPVGLAVTSYLGDRKRRLDIKDDMKLSANGP